ncbi:hypothetical protein GCM10011505_15380 [Tistrella bauzanensis]|uniref:Uncharacterized protein n=1 Tax=Tistrella bauzanensis TaxID=657419 RepID=A0ABQ1ICM8_9PROT|nr:hypothetical protein GCM10011505_15380 [Tistrella bauzanensis]
MAIAGNAIGRGVQDPHLPGSTGQTAIGGQRLAAQQQASLRRDRPGPVIKGRDPAITLAGIGGRHIGRKDRGGRHHGQGRHAGKWCRKAGKAAE